MKENKERCPSCGNLSVRRRGVNMPGNIKRRKVEDRTHRYICDNNDCKWTGTHEDIDWTEKIPESANSALEW